MIQEAVEFTKLHKKILNISFSLPDLHLNSPFMYQIRNKQSLKSFNRPIELFCERYMMLDTMYKQINHQQNMLSSIKITPKKVSKLSSSQATSRYENFKDSKWQTKFKETQSTQTPKSNKYSEFIVQADEKQQRFISKPTISKKFGISQNFLINPIQKDRNCGGWNMCTQMCNIQSCYEQQQQQIDSYSNKIIRRKA